MSPTMNMSQGGDDTERLNQQIDFLKFAYGPTKLPACLAGGLAENALLDGKATKPVEKIKMVARDLYTREIITKLGLAGFTIEPTPATGEPFKLKATKENLEVDIAFAAWDTEKMKPRLDIEIERVPGTKEKIQIFLEKDGLSSPAQKQVNGVEVGTVSPLCLIQLNEMYAWMDANNAGKYTENNAGLKATYFQGEDVNSDKFFPTDKQGSRLG